MATHANGQDAVAAWSPAEVLIEARERDASGARYVEPRDRFTDGLAKRIESFARSRHERLSDESLDFAVELFDDVVEFLLGRS